jgi:hypothetical protein
MGHGSCVNLIQPAAPHRGVAAVRAFVRARIADVTQDALLHNVALQVAFERQTLKPVFPLDRF